MNETNILLIKNSLINLFDKMGGYGTLILLISSNYFLWNKKNLWFYYNVGFFINVILNLILKFFFKQPRPSIDEKLFRIALQNGERFIYKNGIPYDIFGMPSGHAQNAIFTLFYVYLATKNINLFYFQLIIVLITVLQRYVFNHHTLFQLIVGSIIGLIISHLFYSFAQQNLMGKIREKIDDFGPI